MLIQSFSSSRNTEADVTDERIYRARRHFLQGLAAAGLLGAHGPASGAGVSPYSEVPASQDPDWLRDKLMQARWQRRDAGDEVLTPFRDVTQYNNFYEFGPQKGDPARHAGNWQPQPWSLWVDGEVARPGRLPLDELLAPYRLQERIYRLRCVEGWSMVIPWLGFPLRNLLERVQPSSHARYVRFESVVDAENMPGVRSGFSLLEWPYREGLRLDEAAHPLTFMAVGLYGRSLPGQNGAPLRLVVPWKYGFKSIKSIVRISFLRGRPLTTWESMAPQEYGFYANVNPHVDHPRWSQARERRLPGRLFAPNVIDTRLFNGYEEVAGLYSNMDLRVNY